MRNKKMTIINKEWTDEYVNTLVSKLEDCRNNGLQVSEALCELEKDPEISKSANAIRQKLNLVGNKYFATTESRKLQWGSHFTHGHLMKNPVTLKLNKPTPWTEELIIKTICILYDFYSKNHTVAEALLILGNENTIGKSANAIRKKINKFGDLYFISDSGGKLEWGKYYTQQEKLTFRKNKKVRIVWTQEEKDFVLNEINKYSTDNVFIDDILANIKREFDLQKDFTHRTVGSIGGFLTNNKVFRFCKTGFSKGLIWNVNYTAERDLENQTKNNFNENHLIRSINLRFQTEESRVSKKSICLHDTLNKDDLYDALSNDDYESDVDLFSPQD
jgi:hypothetical protein